MDKAYARCPEDSETFDLSFHYNNREQRINKQFNFSRKLSETVTAFMSRIKINMEKAVKKPKKKEPLQESVEISVTILQNEQEVNSELTCDNLFKNGGDIILRICNTDFSVIINSPWVKTLALPSCIMVGFLVYPNKFETMFFDKILSEFKWFKSTDKQNWLFVASGYYYTPNYTDSNNYLKFECVPKNSMHCGPSVETVSSEKVVIHAEKFPFETRHLATRDKLKGDRVVSYNILADLYCDSDYSRETLFPYCPAHALDIGYRKQLILKELIGFNADVICLQETDSKVYDNDLMPILGQQGLEGLFYKKGGTVKEGLACFYDKSRFNLRDSKFVVLKDEVVSNPVFDELWMKVCRKEDVARRFLEKSTSLQLVELETVEGGEVLLVANTHLYFHPEADHIRLLQGTVSIHYINSVIKQIMHKDRSKRIGLIFCGDFNSVPSCGIYKLYTTGHVPETVEDWINTEAETLKDVVLHQDRLLSSAYGTPEYTNYTDGFKDCLDYIYYDSTHLELLGTVPLPTEQELSERVALPSILFPSDHVSLIANFKWKAKVTS